MKPNIHKMTKKEICELADYRCKHGHNGLSHYNCYRNEQGLEEKVGFLDIECSNLKANFGVMLSWCIKPAGSKKKDILQDVASREDLTGKGMDKRIVQSCVDAMEGFDRIVGHYSSRFDVPFIRTRALMHGIPFPKYGQIKHTDTWRMAKQLLCLHSNRQDVVAEALQGKTVKTRINSDYWIKALQGDEKALAYVLDHNIKDVIDLEKNYNKMEEFFRRVGTSL